MLFPCYFCTIPLLFQCYFHATFALFPYYFSAISMLSFGYFAELFPCYFTDDARNQSNYIKTNYPLEENGMYQRLLYLFTRFEVLPNSNWHQKSVFRENCLKWKLSVEFPTLHSVLVNIWPYETPIQQYAWFKKSQKRDEECFGETFGTQGLLMFCFLFSLSHTDIDR